MTLHIVDSVDYTVTTDALGYFNYTFAGNYDQVFATVNSPQVSNGLIGCSAMATGPNTVKVRVWCAAINPDAGSVQHCTSQQVTVSLLAVAG